ncbi:MAG: hypothetical protein ACREEM_00385 [Blastocatellia bacterium]
MKIYFYQANFCAECGNAMKPRFSWGPRYFCDDCARQMGRGSHVKSILALLFGTTLIVTALNRTEPPAPVNPSSPAPAVSSVSAHDATAVQRPILKTDAMTPLKADATTRVLCGARTKKGTPCKHLVLPGQRCAQHRGRASILEPPQSAAASR